MINLFDCLSRYLSSDERAVQHAPSFEGWKSGFSREKISQKILSSRLRLARSEATKHL